MNRIEQLTATRNRLNNIGEPTHHYIDHARDTVIPNGGAWNKKRIHLRNKINARLRALGC